MPYSWLDYNIGLNFIPKKILPDLIPEGLFLSKSIKITAISTIFFYTVQDLVCILKNALSWIFSVCKGNTDTQGNCRGYHPLYSDFFRIFHTSISIPFIGFSSFIIRQQIPRIK